MTSPKYNAFPSEVIDQIGYYVYRLIDPRNGNTFYVGKGQGNRVFDHVKQQIKLSKNIEDENNVDDDNFRDSLKYETIRNIHKAGLEVIHIIHRYKLTEEEALEVEAALIDCFPGLTNVKQGVNSDRGVINTETLIKDLSTETFEVLPKDRFILIKTSQKAIEIARDNYPNASEEELIYHAVRAAWKMRLDRAKQYKNVVGSINGIVVGCYQNCKWKTSEEDPCRILFEGKTANQKFCERFMGKRVPDEYRKKGCAIPYRYIDG